MRAEKILNIKDSDLKMIKLSDIIIKINKANYLRPFIKV